MFFVNRPFPELLRQGITELQEFRQTPSARYWDKTWFDHLNSRLEQMITLTDMKNFEHAFTALFRSLIDSGPGTEAAPSLGLLMDALQRSRKRTS